MSTWQETQGTVLETSIGSGQSRYKSSAGGYKYRTSYFPQITYQYSVNGTDYVNNRFSRHHSLINRTSVIENILAKYPVGSTVTVYYDPQNPAESFLEKGFGSATNKLLLVILLLSLGIIAVVVVLLLIL